MQTHDKKPFGQTLIGTFEVYGRQAPSADALRVWWGILEPYPLEAIQRAMDRYVRTELQHPPTPAKILAMLGEGAGDNRPEADEAWAIALRATDEAATVVWTDEIAQAMSAARPVLDAGDDVGARMAFRAAYTRLVADARAARRPVQWMASLGHDPEQRQEALEQAAQKNLLPAPAVAALLPPPAESEPAMGSVVEANLQRLNQLLGAAFARRPSAAETANAAERERLAGLKAASGAKVNQYLGEQA
jgi:hypothetical protein